MPEARLVILRSPNGEDGWETVNPKDVPDWLQDPAVMGRLVDGEMAQGPVNVVLPDELRPWYKAVLVETITNQLMDSMALSSSPHRTLQ